MTIWKNCRADIYYTNDHPELNDPGYEVRITGDEIVISYEGNTGWVNYTGHDHGDGHFELTSPEVKGRAVLHRMPEGDILEGNWSEEGERGMWRVHLID